MAAYSDLLSLSLLRQSGASNHAGTGKFLHFAFAQGKFAQYVDCALASYFWWRKLGCLRTPCSERQAGDPDRCRSAFGGDVIHCPDGCRLGMVE